MENLTKRINVGHRKFGNNLTSFEVKKPEKIILQFFPIFDTKFFNRRALKKNQKSFLPEPRVVLIFTMKSTLQCTDRNNSEDSY